MVPAQPESNCEVDWVETEKYGCWVRNAHICGPHLASLKQMSISNGSLKSNQNNVELERISA